MQIHLATGLVLLAALSACSDDNEDHRNAEAAVAAGFRPPTVLARVDFGSDLDRRFQALDLNGDGALDRSEWPAEHADRIAALDGNKDGKVTSGEFIEGLMARFDAADTNQDQVLTSDERAAADIPNAKPGKGSNTQDAAAE